MSKTVSKSKAEVEEVGVVGWCMVAGGGGGSGGGGGGGAVGQGVDAGGGGGAKLSRGQLARLQGGAGDGRTMIDVRSMASVSGLGSRCGQNVDGL